MKKALLIGINYINDINARLYGCINDNIALKNMLVDAYGYRDENITFLRDDVSNLNIIPTRFNILNNLKKIVSESGSLSEIWIHYSGHGSYIYNINSDEIDKQDEVIVPLDYKTNGVIIDNEIRDLLNNSKTRIILTTDCCHSGSICDLPYSYIVKNNTIIQTEISKIMLNKNIYKLSSSRDDQTSIDSYCEESRVNMGAFTMGLLKSLRKRNHNTTLIQLYIDINEYFKNNNLTQECVLSSSNDTPYIKITRNGINVINTTNKNIGNFSTGNGRFNMFRNMYY